MSSAVHCIPSQIRLVFCWRIVCTINCKQLDKVQLEVHMFVLLHLCYLSSLISGTPQWDAPFSLPPRAMITRWVGGGRCGLASTNQCDQLCGRWCWTLMVKSEIIKTQFHLNYPVTLSGCGYVVIKDKKRSNNDRLSVSAMLSVLFMCH